MLKKCTKCRRELEVALENFGPCKAAGDGFQSQCRECKQAYDEAHRVSHREEHKVACKKYYAANTGKAQVYAKKYYDTLSGYIRRLFHRMNWRCRDKKCYVENGIRNMFESSDEFVNYVVNEL